MRLTKLILCNYRSFAEKTSIEIDNFSTFIGSNSSGKSTILSALAKLFSESSQERTIVEGDFHKPLNSEDDDTQTEKELYIEAQFVFDGAMEDIPSFFEHVTANAEGEPPFLRIRLTATLQKNQNVPTIDQRLAYITCPESEGDITDEDKRTVNTHHLQTIRIIYVPALRDPSSQLRSNSSSMLHRLFNTIRWSEETSTSINDAIEGINALLTSETGTSLIGNAISDRWKKYDTDPRYTTAELKYSEKNLTSISKAIDVFFSPTPEEREYSVRELGDGLRSLFYFSLMDSILTVEEKISNKEDGADEAFDYIPPYITILAVEEPENNIAPHLLGKLIVNLEAIANKKTAQVLMTSHSPATIMRIEPDKIRFCRMQENGSTAIKMILLPEKTAYVYKYVKEAVKAYPELYFAKLVILGEGDSEELILKKCFEVSDLSHDINGISIVPLGGRHVNHFWKLLKELEIPHITLLDLDRERYQGGWGRIHYALEQLIKNGDSKDELLKISDDEILSDEDFDTIPTWDVTAIENMQAWIEYLEDYNVFFSSPLDIDFLMLQTFEQEYKSIIQKNEGPELSKTNKTKILQLSQEDKQSKDYEVKYKISMKHTLKDKSTDGSTFTKEEKELMIFYDYFFLGRGKPTTHLLAFSEIDNDKLRENMPEVLQKIITRAHEELFPNGDNGNE